MRIQRAKLWPVVALLATLPVGLALTNRPTIAWETWRTVTDDEDTNYAAATQQTAGSSTADGTVVCGQNVGALIARFRGTAAADKTLGWCLWARKSLGDPAEFVAHGTATTGVTQTGGTNEFYCDTIVITAQSWYTKIDVIDGAPAAIVADGGIARLIWDSCEYEVWEIKIYDIAGGGAECATAGADVQNFRL